MRNTLLVCFFIQIDSFGSKGRKECEDEDLSNFNSDNDIWAAQ